MGPRSMRVRSPRHWELRAFTVREPTLEPLSAFLKTAEDGDPGDGHRHLLLQRLRRQE
jgi:hypothetical protein